MHISDNQSSNPISNHHHTALSSLQVNYLVLTGALPLCLNPHVISQVFCPPCLVPLPFFLYFFSCIHACQVMNLKWNHTVAACSSHAPHQLRVKLHVCVWDMWPATTEQSRAGTRQPLLYRPLHPSASRAWAVVCQFR